MPLRTEQLQSLIVVSALCKLNAVKVTLNGNQWLTARVAVFILAPTLKRIKKPWLSPEMFSYLPLKVPIFGLSSIKLATKENYICLQKYFHMI